MSCLCFLFIFIHMYSLEPGYYKENDFGIRIEDIAVLVPVQTKVKLILLYCVVTCSKACIVCNICNILQYSFTTHYYYSNLCFYQSDIFSVSMRINIVLLVLYKCILISVHTHCSSLLSLIQYGNNFLTFDTVSLVPYDRKLIDTSLLSPQQVNDSVSL